MKTQYLSLLLIALTPCFLACLWDYDTIQMEQRKFPDTLELITGKFLRHSDTYYQWRIKDREPKLKNAPTPELYDDLAVAHEKLGSHDKAIELMIEKEASFPGLYETRANLGTFLIHAGRLEEGVTEIEKAIEINPDAHFGREIYQLELVKYVLSKQVDEKTKLPLNSVAGEEKNTPYPECGFAKHLNVSANSKGTEIYNAIKGVKGMMRFGNFDSPILLEALGDLLRTSKDSNLLATRAYLKASYEADSEESKQQYREKAIKCIELQIQFQDKTFPLSSVETELKKEISESDDWFQSIADDEQTWMEKGLNLDEEFSKVYYQEPRIRRPFRLNRNHIAMLSLAGLAVGLWFLAVGRKALSGKKKS